ncbi:MAG: hypothetical protein JW917_05875 [Ignavibacteria bacterium]|nr:hypothetical protein [Ignavibacteria bacterium]
MKYFIFLFLIVIAGFNCSSSEQSADWSVVNLVHESGPLPPQYQYSYSVIINSDKTGEYLYSYPMGDEKKLQYKFSITGEQMKELFPAIKKSRIMEINIPKLPDEKVPVGGSLTKVKITVVNPNPGLDQPPKVYESPYFPTEEYKGNLEALYKYIVNLVPKEFIKKASEERDNYINTFDENN